MKVDMMMRYFNVFGTWRFLVAYIKTKKSKMACIWSFIHFFRLFLSVFFFFITNFSDIHSFIHSDLKNFIETERKKRNRSISLINGYGFTSRQIQARFLRRSIRWQNQYHHPLHVRQIRHHLSGSILHSRFQFCMDYSD